MWLDAEYIKLFENIFNLMAEGKRSLDDYKKELEPFFKQMRLQEQAFIIQRLYNSGMTVEEISFRLGRKTSFIEEICSLELENGYDFSYIRNAVPFSE